MRRLQLRIVEGGRLDQVKDVDQRGNERGHCQPGVDVRQSASWVLSGHGGRSHKETPTRNAGAAQSMWPRLRQKEAGAALSGGLREGANVFSSVRVLGRKFIGIAELDVARRIDSRPFSRAAKEPAAHACDAPHAVKTSSDPLGMAS